MTRHFVLDRGAALHNVLMEADTNGLPVRYYIWGARGLLAQVETNGAVYYFHADEQGSTLALTDTNGAVVAEYAYSPYGEVLDQTGGVETPYTFGGGYGAYHEGGSLYYIKARYYEADLRRWLSKDPIGLSGGLNLYTFCRNNPVNFIDPWGLCEDQPWYQDTWDWFNDEIWSYVPKSWDDFANDPGWEGLPYAIGVAGTTPQALIAIEGVGPAVGQFFNSGWINQNRYLRIGFSRLGGESVFRIAGEWVRNMPFVKDGHIILRNLGPL